MSVDITQFHQVFFEETAEHLANMESLVLGLDLAAPEDDDLNAIFRCAHSIKGGSGTFGFADMAEVTHVLETLLDKVRKHELALSPPMIDAFLRAGDVIRAQLGAHRGGEPVDPAEIASVCALLASLAAAEAVPAGAAQPDPAPAVPLGPMRIRFSAPPKGVVDNLLEELRSLGELTIVERPRATRSRKAGPGPWVLELAGASDAGRVRELAEFAADDVAVDFDGFAPPGDRLSGAVEASGGASADAFAASGSATDAGYGFFDDTPPAPAPAAGGDYGFFDDAPGAAPAVVASSGEDAGYGFFDPVAGPTAEAPIPAGAEAEPPARGHGRRSTDQPGAEGTTAGRRQGDRTVVAGSGESSIRVSVEKVDQLINLVGELVITQAMLSQTASQVDPVLYERLLNGLAQLERNTRDLQESVMGIRMMPISFVFSRFPRMARDVAAKLGKEVELRTVGEGTELDKGVIERIADPLTHLVRNSLDHGIETPELRLAAGKPAKGTVTLRAYHQGGSIMVEVSDDGRGLDRDRILAKAAERGMPASEAMTDQDVFKLIFAPGFSTAETITDVSGRGVGMDVVKRNIEGMGGGIEIDSAQGVGTRITIRLPLTLAILDGLSVQVGKEIYIVPLTYITESLQPRGEDLRTIGGSGVAVQVRGEYLPVVPLAGVFGVSGAGQRPETGILVIVEAEGGRVALAVDALVSQHQVVIKSLETNYRRVHGVSGATIMGDGRVALILDVAALVRLTRGTDRLAA